ncbi:hypothetical protein SAMN05421579_103114 [Xenorhabdus japonica]|uniref:Uncharacterized protein n=1 Tax=Xenorhabdus japonica TaxID=53341 RepID=A0A1I4YY15_9GAMM|nr:hypothetical protein SAMN05421579_103114 [Xenorhabdus japonica]
MVLIEAEMSENLFEKLSISKQCVAALAQRFQASLRN